VTDTAVSSPVAAAEQTAGPTDKPWRRAWLAGLVTWAIAFGTYLLVNAVTWTLGRDPVPQPADFFSVWNRWDTGHYITIATTGYSLENENTAFFPLYPMLMRYLNPVLPGGMLSAGMIIASAACIVALAVIYRLVEDLFDRGTAARTTTYLMASPFAFFLVAAYNESLFLALCAGSLYCMRRGHWWVAGALAGFASATRQAGVLLALAFVIEYMRQRGWRPRALRSDVFAILLVPTGLIAFMLYSAREFGDPLRFVHVQSFWGRELSPPWHGIEGSVRQAAQFWPEGPFSTWVVLNVIDLATVLAAVVLLVLAAFGRWRLGSESWYLIAFASAGLLTVLLNSAGWWLPPLHGLPRYVLELVPIFVVLARMGANRNFDRAYLFPALALQTALLMGYFAYVWVA
jgi:Mannosyltransferase (PIG-V)